MKLIMLNLEDGPGLIQVGPNCCHMHPYRRRPRETHRDRRRKGNVTMEAEVAAMQ
jgi:hypothetical protein